jgi:predicted NBD/HSP70 family sugar kinase
MDVGLDIGGTKTLGMLLEGDSVVKKGAPMDTGSNRGRDHIRSQLSSYISDLTQGRERDIESITYAISGPSDGTIVTSCLNTPEFVRWDMHETLPEHLQHKQFSLQRDSTAFAYGESLQRQGRVLGVIFGTGVSACIVDGKPECFGHKGHRCTAEVYRDGTLDIHDVHENLGARNIIARYGPHLDQMWTSTDDAARAMQDGIVAAAEKYLNHLHRIFSPDITIIGGGQSKSPLIERLQRIVPYTIERSTDTSLSAIIGGVNLSRLERGFYKSQHRPELYVPQTYAQAR